MTPVNKCNPKYKLTKPHNMTAVGVSVIILVLIVGFGTHQRQAFASSESNSKRYDDGFNNAPLQSSNYDTTCDPYKQYTSDGTHTRYYCDGWTNGYNAGWNSKNNNENRDNTNNGNQQSSDVNIRGNNKPCECKPGTESEQWK